MHPIPNAYETRRPPEHGQLENERYLQQRRSEEKHITLNDVCMWGTSLANNRCFSSSSVLSRCENSWLQDCVSCSSYIVDISDTSALRGKERFPWGTGALPDISPISFTRAQSVPSFLASSLLGRSWIITSIAVSPPPRPWHFYCWKGDAISSHAIGMLAQRKTKEIDAAIFCLLALYNVWNVTCIIYKYDSSWATKL